MAPSKQVSPRPLFKLYRLPRRLYWTSFWAGIFQGLGSAIGATFVLGFILYLFSRVSLIPVLGSFITRLSSQLNSFPVAP